MGNDSEMIKKEFHRVNNWLNKITVMAGQARYELETKGFNLEKLEEERERYIQLLDNMEDYAMKIGDILKDLRKVIDKGYKMAKKILIVDDEQNIALILKEFFISKGYDVMFALTGKEAMECLGRTELDLILLDIQMPDMNGIEILRQVKAKFPAIKTVVLTGFLEEYKEQVEALGYDAFLSKPFSIKTLLKVVNSTLFDNGERESYFETVLALAQTLDEKDASTRGHLDEVTRYGMDVAEELLNSKGLRINTEELKTALMLHDIGKIGVPDAILHKNDKLTFEEWGIMKQHPEMGERIIEPIAKLKRVGNIIRYHQEKYDGTGYPDGLKGEEIPLESRIIAVVDAYHAMVSDRPYRKALSETVAVAELRNNKGTQFDPVIVDAFLKVLERAKVGQGGIEHRA